MHIENGRYAPDISGVAISCIATLLLLVMFQLCSWHYHQLQWQRQFSAPSSSPPSAFEYTPSSAIS